jgi:hypothetical protein
MRKIVLSAATIVGLVPMIGRAEAFHRVEPTVYVYAYRGYTNPGYFSGVTIRVHEPRCYCRYYRHRKHRPEAMPLK